MHPKFVTLACTLLCTALFAQQKGTFTDTRDGKIYKTVKIGEQVWMAENLNYEASGSKCYDNKPANCSKYGRLYNRETAMKACPNGWHLPFDAEWNILTKAAHGESAGKYLKATSDWKDHKGKSGNGEDKFGFSALPGGWGGPDGSFSNVGEKGYWWIANSPEYWRIANYPESRYMYYNGDGVSYNYDGSTSKSKLFSIRCLQGDAKEAEAKEAAAKAARAAKKAEKAAAEAEKEKAEREAYVKVYGGTFTDTRDKKTYKTIKMGEQIWMAENLNYAASGSKCYYNRPKNCDIYGRLYNLKTAMKACPSGWHLPSNKEWDILYRYATRPYGDDGTAIYYLKAANGWEDHAYSFGNGKDKFGFSALPGGWGYSDGSFNGIRDYGCWWSVGDDDMDKTNWKTMRSRNTKEAFLHFGGEYLYSVRCVQKAPKPKGSTQQKETFTDTRDGKTYKTIKIGEQIWMAENLNYETSGSKCNGEGGKVFNQKTRKYDITLSNAEIQTNCNKYGKLYDWEAAMKACPSGWHLPSKEEWGVLTKVAGGDKIAGLYLKAINGWIENGNGEDKYGFSALPGGLGRSGGSFSADLSAGLWWSSSEYSSGSAHSLRIVDSHDDVHLGYDYKNSLKSIRCLQNTPAPPKGEAK